MKKELPPTFPWKTIWTATVTIFTALIVCVAATTGYVYYQVLPTLPSLDVVTDYKPQIPLRVYTQDHILIGEFGEEHRRYMPLKEMPDLMKAAVLAIEDTRFYEHGGIDWYRIAGAITSHLRGGTQGGSTITMQLARNFFLTREKVMTRKFGEVLLAYRIESSLSKDKILEIYMNQIYLGQRSFGFGAAAETYFGKSLSNLSLAQIAMLAGLPQNPGRHNPVVNFKQAKQRQQVVLKRLYELAHIDGNQYRSALKEIVLIDENSRQRIDMNAAYVAEYARQAMYSQFKNDAYTQGFVVTTTIRKLDQDTAYEAVRRNAIAYDHRHGYRGPEAYLKISSDSDEVDDAIQDALDERPNCDDLIPAVVLSASEHAVHVRTNMGENLVISDIGLKFAKDALKPTTPLGQRIRRGAIVRISKNQSAQWEITQLPQVASAFVSLDAKNGAIQSMIGGFHFNLQKLNHATQVWRQPGSVIKPFYYSAALEAGFSPSTIIEDSPLTVNGPETNYKAWSPQNHDRKFDGPISMRYALVHSRNVASVRLLQAITVPYASDFVERFGFDPRKQPRNLTVTLGTGAVTPLQVAGGFATFANGGLQIAPHLISRITNASGSVLFAVEDKSPPRILDPRNAFIIDSILRDVAQTGTAASATQHLKRSDLAGKTGTTSNFFDGWYAGYGGGLVGVAWMGYDSPRSLGRREYGVNVAMPIWIDYMKIALTDRPMSIPNIPSGLTVVDDDWMYKEYASDNLPKLLDME